MINFLDTINELRPIFLGDANQPSARILSERIPAYVWNLIDLQERKNLVSTMGSRLITFDTTLNSFYKKYYNTGKLFYRMPDCEIKTKLEDFHNSIAGCWHNAAGTVLSYSLSIDPRSTSVTPLPFYFDGSIGGMNSMTRAFEGLTTVYDVFTGRIPTIKSEEVFNWYNN